MGIDYTHGGIRCQVCNFFANDKKIQLNAPNHVPIILKQ